MKFAPRDSPRWVRGTGSGYIKQIGNPIVRLRLETLRLEIPLMSLRLEGCVSRKAKSTSSNRWTLENSVDQLMYSLQHTNVMTTYCLLARMFYLKIATQSLMYLATSTLCRIMRKIRVVHITNSCLHMSSTELLGRQVVINYYLHRVYNII